jgi:hypothetical protein
LSRAQLLRWCGRVSLESGELSLQLVPDNEVVKLPFFVRLHPEVETAPEKITLKAGGEGKAEIEVPSHAA